LLRGASQATRPERANKKTKKLDVFRMRFWAVGNLPGRAVQEVGLSRTRDDSFWQKIAFRVHGKLCFISGATGMDLGPGPEMPRPGTRLAPGAPPSEFCHDDGERGAFYWRFV